MEDFVGIPGIPSCKSGYAMAYVAYMAPPPTEGSDLPFPFLTFPSPSLPSYPFPFSLPPSPNPVRGSGRVQ